MDHVDDEDQVRIVYRDTRESFDQREVSTDRGPSPNLLRRFCHKRFHSPFCSHRQEQKAPNIYEPQRE